jgi:hypothetical protein
VSRKGFPQNAKAQMTKPIPIHGDCLGCLALADQSDGLTAEEAVITIAVMWSQGVTTAQMLGDLCFLHRRMVAGLMRETTSDEV